MFLEQAGTGKTTLINFYVKNLMKIKYKDNFRYKIINDNFEMRQTYSKKENIINYNIKIPDGKN